VLSGALSEGAVPIRPRLRAVVMVSHAVRCLEFQAIEGSLVLNSMAFLSTELIETSVDCGRGWRVDPR
jgi:hypothetical protein